mmetsp:Transcript_101020/g.314923  ORF Transcript_101020/g.314923 Transcript_101020/m.314923 type:complete len:259 (-) Transcript_101020:3-779(-)
MPPPPSPLPLLRRRWSSSGPWAWIAAARAATSSATALQTPPRGAAWWCTAPGRAKRRRAGCCWPRGSSTRGTCGQSPPRAPCTHCSRQSPPLSCVGCRAQMPSSFPGWWRHCSCGWAPARSTACWPRWCGAQARGARAVLHPGAAVRQRCPLLASPRRAPVSLRARAEAYRLGPVRHHLHCFHQRHGHCCRDGNTFALITTVGIAEEVIMDTSMLLANSGITHFTLGFVDMPSAIRVDKHQSSSTPAAFLSPSSRNVD